MQQNMSTSVHSLEHYRFRKKKCSVCWDCGVFVSFFFFWSFGAASATSHHPLQDVEDADAVDGDEGGEVGWDVDPLQRGSRRIEGLQGLAFLHVPPLAKKTERKTERPLKCFRLLTDDTVSEYLGRKNNQTSLKTIAGSETAYYDVTMRDLVDPTNFICLF